MESEGTMIAVVSIICVTLVICTAMICNTIEKVKNPFAGKEVK